MREEEQIFNHGADIFLVVEINVRSTNDLLLMLAFKIECGIYFVNKYDFR